ncbi:MAG: SdiA-regulated domain-containing protein [Saprospiraceae bacterium]|nr:SdiA-regulated domain-containing protein [Saprospiraceae bacterium]
MKFRFHLYSLLCASFVFFSFGTCKTQKQAAPRSEKHSLPYDLSNPNLTIRLSNEELTEISGLSPSDQNDIYLAIADEKGEIYFLNAEKGGAIQKRVLFLEKGDFEGVEMAGQTLWAVKSNGTLYEIKDWANKPAPSITEHKTSLNKLDDVEGLGLDLDKNALLLACKGNPDSSYLRNVYAFDLKSKLLSRQPVYAVDPLEINQLVPYLESEKPDFFSPSGIAMHPVSKDVYIISSALKRLVVLDGKTGKIREAVRLDKKILPQPEGISFDKTGNLFISSEGKNGAGLLLKFDYHK